MRASRKANRRLGGRRIHLVIFLFCLTLVMTAYLLPTDKALAKELGFRWHLYCFMDDIFGLKCASCALARSLTAFTKGHVTQAFEYYPLGPIIFLYLCFQIPYRLVALARAPKAMSTGSRRINAGLTLIVVGLIIVDWLFLMGGPVI